MWVSIDTAVRPRKVKIVIWMRQCEAEVHIGVVSTNLGHHRLLCIIVAGHKRGREDGGTEIGLTHHWHLVEPHCCCHVLICCGGCENVIVIQPVWEIQWRGIPTTSLQNTPAELLQLQVSVLAHEWMGGVCLCWHTHEWMGGVGWWVWVWEVGVVWTLNIEYLNPDVFQL